MLGSSPFRLILVVLFLSVLEFILPTVSYHHRHYQLVPYHRMLAIKSDLTTILHETYLNDYRDKSAAHGTIMAVQEEEEQKEKKKKNVILDIFHQQS